MNIFIYLLCSTRVKGGMTTLNFTHEWRLHRHQHWHFVGACACVRMREINIYAEERVCVRSSNTEKISQLRILHTEVVSRQDKYNKRRIQLSIQFAFLFIKIRSQRFTLQIKSNIQINQTLSAISFRSYPQNDECQNVETGV